MRYTLSVLITIVTALSSLAQLSGSLSGVISTGHYSITGDIFVQQEDTLVIEPGVTFSFSGDYQFEIRGYFYAVGTESDSIVFKQETTGTNWKGIYFKDSASDSSRLEYCYITDGQAGGDWPCDCGGGILCVGSSPSIINCSIIGNCADYYGGGIFCHISSNPVISNCVIANNTAVIDGGGVSCNLSNPMIRNCLIKENSANSGGGIYCGNGSNPQISECEVKNNSATDGGGGIYCFLNSNPNILKSVINENTAGGSGGGISCYRNSEFNITESEISDNTATNYGGGFFCDNNSNLNISGCVVTVNTVVENNGAGGGIFCRNSYASLSNCIICENVTSGSFSDGGGIYCRESNLTVNNCTICNNSAIDGGGGFYCFYYSVVNGKSNIIWANSAYCQSQIYKSIESSFFCEYSDIELGWGGNGNIAEDPLFYAISGDSAYHLTTDSPCIDTGDPNGPLDPDSTRTDMGAYYFDQSSGVNSPKHSYSATAFILNPPYPNPFNASTVLPFALQKDGNIKLAVFDLSGRETAVLIDGYYPAGSHIVNFKGENLPSGIYFARLGTEEQYSTRKMLLIK